MLEIYQTELEKGLELTLEQIGYPLSRRIYFGAISMEREVLRESLRMGGEILIRECPEFERYRSIFQDTKELDRIIEKAKKEENKKEEKSFEENSDPFFLLLEEIADLMMVNGDGADENKNSLIKRMSQPNKKGGYINYFLSPLNKDINLIMKESPDSRVELINGLIKNRRYSYEHVLIYITPLDLCSIEIPHYGKKDPIVKVGKDPKQNFFDCFAEFHNQPLNTKKLIKRISEFMQF